MAYDQQFQKILHLFLVVLILMKVLLAEVMLQYLLDAVLAQILLQKQSITRSLVAQNMDTQSCSLFALKIQGITWAK